MQRQEINLFKPFEVRRPADNFLNWNRLMYIYAIVAAIFTVFYLYDLYSVHNLNSQNTKANAEARQYQKDFLALKQTFPPLFFTSDVGLTVESLQKELNDQKTLLSSLSISSTFSRDLIIFANDIVPDVWLTNIGLLNNGNDISLKGKSTNMENLQKFISQLSANESYKGFAFNLDNITKVTNPKDDGHILFELSMRKPKA